MQLVRRVWPAVIEARIETARDLSQILGEDHDLAMLKAFAAAASDDAVAARFRAEIIACCGDRQRSLRRQARPLANRLFAETPAAFTDRIEAYWRAARRLERLQLRAGRTPEPAADTPEEK